jgi:aminopeptidase YwaD
MSAEIVAAARGSNSLLPDFDAICDTGGRFAGTESEAAARNYLKRRLAEIGRRQPFAHEVDYLGWTRGPAKLERLDGAAQSFDCVSLVRSPKTGAAGLTAELLDLGRGTEADFDAHAADIPGKIVMVRHEYMFSPVTIHRRRKYQWALERGAAGFLIACHVPGAGPVTGSSGATPERGIPAAGISAETAAALTQNGPAKLRLTIDATETKTTTENLILDLPGKTPEWVVLSAHIDGHHLAESAMDNATGLAAALAVAEVMAPHMHKMARGLRVGFFTIEEWALAGSAAYVDGLSEAERDTIKIDVNLDTIAGSPNLTALTSDFAKMESWLQATAAGHGFSLGAHRPLMANSDHYNFARHGIPATRLVAGFDERDSDIKYVLTPGDTRARIREQDFRNATALTAALVAEACSLETLELR